VDFDPADFASFTVDNTVDTTAFVVATGVSAPNGDLSLSTPIFQGFDADLSVAYGGGAIFSEGREGRGFEIGAQLNLRPTAGLRISLLNTYNRITRTDGSLFARTIIPRLKVEFQPSRALFFRVVGEYVSQKTTDLVDPASGNPILVNGVALQGGDDNNFRLDLLASFEPTPGTVAFLGYGSSMEGNKTLGFSDLRRTSDGFFVKLAYQFRR
jgi:hypothetical protein